jgi:hypothetical protein
VALGSHQVLVTLVCVAETEDGLSARQLTNKLQEQLIKATVRRRKHIPEVYCFGLDLELDNRSSVSSTDNDGILLLSNRVKTGSGDHPASYPTGNGGSYTADKATGA